MMATHDQRRPFARIQVTSPGTVGRTAASAPYAHTSPSARSSSPEENVLLWSAYLPTECIQSMIKAGWDHTTEFAPSRSATGVSGSSNVPCRIFPPDAVHGAAHDEAPEFRSGERGGGQTLIVS